MLLLLQFHLDGIDVDYEQFSDDPDTYTHCIGRLITTLKKNGVISYTSIAPYDDDQAQSHYKALWRSYGHLIDYVTSSSTHTIRPPLSLNFWSILRSRALIMKEVRCWWASSAMRVVG